MTRDGLRERWLELVRAFLKIGALSYGGPAIMGLMQTEFQEKRAWLSKERFLEGLALVSMLPGAAATQLGIFIGHARMGWWGGLLAGLCFVAPAFLVMLMLTVAYAEYGALPRVRDVFYGLAPVVVGIFVVAVWRLGRAAVGDTRQGLLVLGATLLAILTPFGIVPTLLLAGALGAAFYGHRRAGVIAALAVLASVGVLRLVGTTADPVAPTPAADGPAGLFDLAFFFFGVGTFSFGGGLSILAFVQDQVVNQFHWLTPREFLDGLALGQLTPGPILMLAAFVGYKVAGVLGALVAAIAIFLPSFVLMLAIVPWLATIKRWQWMRAALKGIGPAVIGLLIAALGDLLPAAVTDVFSGLLLAGAIVAVLVWRVSPLPPMALGAAAGLLGKLVR